MPLNIYLFFPGNCAEAFRFYQSVLGGEITFSSTFAEGPPDMGVSDEDLDKIMHMTFTIGDNRIMGSDSVASCGGIQPVGGSFAISYHPATKEDADEVFGRLFEGGEIQMDMADTFWGSYFGSGKDRFGINWMLNVDTQGT